VHVCVRMCVIKYVCSSSGRPDPVKAGSEIRENVDTAVIVQDCNIRHVKIFLCTLCIYLHTCTVVRLILYF